MPVPALGTMVINAEQLCGSRLTETSMWFSPPQFLGLPVRIRLQFAVRPIQSALRQIKESSTIVWVIHGQCKSKVLAGTSSQHLSAIKHFETPVETLSREASC